MILFTHKLIQKKTRLSLAFKVYLFVANSEDFISPIHHKEGDCHDDINN